jgi:hypothetical protein
MIARAQVADQEQKRANKVTQDFLTEFERVKDKIIVPTLNEIGKMLQETGWTYEIEEMPYAKPNVRFAVDLETMWNNIEEGPYMEFTSLSACLKIDVFCYTKWRRCDEEYLLDEVSEDFVAQQALSFFDQLVADWDEHRARPPLPRWAARLRWEAGR